MNPVDILLLFVFLGIPAALLVFFLRSLIVYRRTPRDDIGLRRKRRTPLVISGTILGVLIAAVGTLMILLMIAVAHM